MESYDGDGGGEMANQRTERYVGKAERAKIVIFYKYLFLFFIPLFLSKNLFISFCNCKHKFLTQNKLDKKFRNKLIFCIDIVCMDIIFLFNIM